LTKARAATAAVAINIKQPFGVNRLKRPAPKPCWNVPSAADSALPGLPPPFQRFPTMASVTKQICFSIKIMQAGPKLSPVFFQSSTIHPQLSPWHHHVEKLKINCHLIIVLSACFARG
jgi:hypothetical protein